MQKQIFGMALLWPKDSSNSKVKWFKATLASNFGVNTFLNHSEFSVAYNRPVQVYIVLQNREVLGEQIASNK